MDSLYWSSKFGPRIGTLKEYITEVYPLYAEKGLFTWQAILEFIKNDPR